jgi:hypothetical protein
LQTYPAAPHESALCRAAGNDAWMHRSMITLRGNTVRDFASVTQNSAIPAAHSGFQCREVLCERRRAVMRRLIACQAKCKLMASRERVFYNFIK